jgi:hypothetical protein
MKRGSLLLLLLLLSAAGVLANPIEGPSLPTGFNQGLDASPVAPSSPSTLGVDPMSPAMFSTLLVGGSDDPQRPPTLVGGTELSATGGSDRSGMDLRVVHRILGYATLAGVVATAASGALDEGEELHGPIAVATSALAVANTGVGLVAYRRAFRWTEPHVLLSAVGTLGFLTTVAFTEPGSTAHVVSGSVASTAFVISVLTVAF